MKKILLLLIVVLLPCSAVFCQKKETYSVRTVVIDPGHGGAKPGAKGSRSYEKDITLAVAKKVGKLIEDNYSDVKVIYTRTTDVDISLADRAKLANSSKADLFLSIHANSHPTSAPTGVETFVMGLSESKANLEVARKENSDILLEADYKNNKDYSDFDPNSLESYVMLTMFQNAFIDKSLNFAQAIQTQYRQHLRTVNRGVKQAELYVLYKTTCPSVLTEIGFISNPTEEAFMLSDEGQAKIAVCIFDAFMTYKATEEGSAKPKKPVYNIKGYIAPGEKEPATSTATNTEKADHKDGKPSSDATKASAESLPVAKAAEEDKQTIAEGADAIAANDEPQKAEPTAENNDGKTNDEKNDADNTDNADNKATADSNTLRQVRQVVTPTDKPLPSAELPQVEAPIDNTAKGDAVKLEGPVNTAASDADQYYTVQFLVAPVLYSKGAAQLDGIEDFSASRKGHSYVYTTGRFATFKQASVYCEHLHTATRFKDAWVFLNKVSSTGTSTAATSEKEETAPTTSTSTTTTHSADAVTYRVQFATATRKMAVGDHDLHGISDFHCSPSGKVFIYTAGNYSTLAEARKRCSKIQSETPFRDAFVIAIYRGERITLEKAAKIGK